MAILKYKDIEKMSDEERKSKLKELRLELLEKTAKDIQIKIDRL